MPDNIIPNVTGETYDIYAKLLEVGGKYFDDDYDFLQTGFMGYNTDAMAMLMRDSILHRNMKHNESFLSSASTVASIYAWAKTFNVELELAKPAKMNIAVLIRQEYIDTHSDNEGVFRINRHIPFYAGEFPFSLEHSILVNQRGNSYTVEWDIDENKLTEFSNIYFNNKYIKWNNYTESEIDYIVFSVPVYQFESKTIQRIVTGTSLIHNRFYNFDFTDQLCGFKVYNNDEPINTYFSDNINKEEGEKFCFYNLVDTNTLQLIFSSMPGDFLPSINSYINTTVVTTRGREGNIEFIGNLSYQFEDDARQNIFIEAIKVSSESALGGKDILSPSELKRKIMQFISSRDNIATEGDLNNYFKELEREREESNSTIYFRKKRADMIKRIFSSYVLLKDKNGKIVPSNTVDFRCPIESNPDNGLIYIPENSNINFVSNDDPKRIRYEFSSDKSSTGFREYDYITPIFTMIKLGFGSDISHVKYIQRGTKDNTNVVYTSSKNDTNIEYIPGNLSIEYDPFDNVDNTLVITYNFSAKGGTINKTILIGDANSSSKYTIQLNNLDLDEEGSNKLEIVLKYKDKPFNQHGTTAEFGEVSKVEFNGDNVTPTEEGTLSFLNEIDFSITTTSDGNIVSELKTFRKLKLFRLLDNIMTSDLEIETDEQEKVKSIVIKDAPVIYPSESNFISNLTQVLNENIDMLLNNIHILTSNFTYDMKFFNTYGLSDVTNSTQTNLKLKLRIHGHKHREIPTSIQTDIKNLIKDFVIESNRDNQLSISLLISLIQANFIDFVSHIDFLGLNGTYIQLLEEIDVDSDLITPEFWNINDADNDGLEIEWR